MKRKMMLTLGIAVLAVSASAAIAASASPSASDDGKVDVLQYLSERLGDPAFYSYDIDGELEFEDVAILAEQIADELGASEEAAAPSSASAETESALLVLDYCTTTGGVITCTNSSTDKDWIWVGKKAASNEVIMCGAVDSAGPYEMIGQEPIGTSTTLRVRGSASFAEAIKFMRVGGVIDACSFDPVAGNLLPSQTIEGGANYYDFIYGSDGNDTLKGEYVMGYGGVDNISIESNMPAIEYAYGGNGNDTIWGNAGNEELYGQNNNDIIHGSGGNDLLRGGPGNDTLYGEADNDTIYGDGPDPGNDNGDIDTLLGGTGSDILYGQYGSDFLDPQGGGTNEICDGGSNNNTPGDGCCPTDCDALINCEYSWSL